MAITISGDGFKGQRIGQAEFARCRNALRRYFVVIANSGTRVINACGRRIVRDPAIADKPRTVFGVRFINGFVRCDADENIIGRRKFRRKATGDDVLVILIGTGGLIVAETVPFIHRNCAADGQAVSQWHCDLTQ